MTRRMSQSTKSRSRRKGTLEDGLGCDSAVGVKPRFKIV
jgi:hypothetical protein